MRDESKLFSVLTIIVLTLPVFLAISTGFDDQLITRVSPYDETTLADTPEDSVPLRKITLVANNPTSYIDEFSYLAAVPTSVFYHTGTQYISPLILSSNSQTEDWLIDDWVDYMTPDGGLTQTIVIGDFSSSRLQDLQFQTGTSIFPKISGDTPASVASQLAVADWESSEVAVFALAKDGFNEPSVSSGSASYTFTGESTTTESQSVAITHSSPVDFTFSPPSDTGWIDGTINWDGTESLRHTLQDPNGNTVDYSSSRWVVFQRSPSLVEELIPLYFWVPVTSSGEWTTTVSPIHVFDGSKDLDIEIDYHPAYRQSVTVPSDAKWFNVTASWDNAATDLNVALIDPTGRLAAWAPVGSIIANPGKEVVNVPYPMEGEWEIVTAWIDADGEENNLELSWDIMRIDQDISQYMESATNGAVLASLLNAPLLYVSESSVPEVTQWATERLGVTISFLVDPASLHSTSLMTELEDFSTVVNLSNRNLVSTWISNLSDSKDVIVTLPDGTGDEKFAPAAFSGAYHGAPVFSLCGDDNYLTTRAEETWVPYLIGPDITSFYVTNKYDERTENGWFDDRIPNRYSMEYSAASFEDFLDQRSAYNSTSRQSVVVVASTELLKLSFDRSLQSHFQTGRFPTDDAALASALINRGSLHRFLFRTSNSADEGLLTLYAYTDGETDADNYGNPVTIRQIEDSLQALQTAGFTAESHIGYQAVYEALDSQVSLWSISTHGTLTRYPQDPPARPGGPGMFSLRDEDASYGFEVSPAERESSDDSDSLVNPVAYPEEYNHHVFLETDQLDAEIDNIGSPIVIITACLLGGSEMPLTLMQHGAVGVTAAPRTVYFRPAGFLSILLTQSLSSGETIGSALSQALNTVSADYTDPLIGEPRDYANQQVLFGDPDVRLLHPDDSERIVGVDQSNTSFDGHRPAQGVKKVASLGTSDTLPTVLYSLGVDYDHYATDNFTGFVRLLNLRRVVVIEPGTLQTFRSDFEESIEDIDSYVTGGGVLAVLGVDGDTGWLPWPVSFTTGSSGSSVSITDSTHPLLTSPNSLSSAVPYQGHFSSVPRNLSVLATNGQEPVIIAGVVGTGKLVLTSTRPTGDDLSDTLENIVSWYESPSLTVSDTSLSQYIIWEGDRVVITLEITDMVGNSVPDIDLQTSLNSTEVTVTEVSAGIYTITLNEEWTSGSAGHYDLHVHASKAGYDTLDTVLLDFIFIRPSPLFALLIGGGIVVAIVVGWMYIKYRRGEEIFSRGKKGKQFKDKSKEEKDRQKEEDEKFDPAEFFGV